MLKKLPPKGSYRNLKFFLTSFVVNEFILTGPLARKNSLGLELSSINKVSLV